VGRRTRKQLVGRMETADRVARERELRRLRRELKLVRKPRRSLAAEEYPETARDEDWACGGPTKE
jgi:hypothetical protein